MNFIDRALQQLSAMSADDLIQAMAQIYSEPIGRQQVKEYPQFVQDIIFIIDYDTELQMEGLSGFLNDSTGQYLDETITALQNCGAMADADILLQLKQVPPDDDDIIDRLEKLTYLHQNFEGLWQSLEQYVQQQREDYLLSQRDKG